MRNAPAVASYLQTAWLCVGGAERVEWAHQSPRMLFIFRGFTADSRTSHRINTALAAICARTLVPPVMVVSLHV
jgi:hypothetical protein